MDLYVEKQCVDQIRTGNMKQFLLLFDANFADLYRYVERRVGESEQIERIARLAFLDALAQVQATPGDTAYLVWLYSLARPRVWEDISRSSFPEKQGLISSTPEEAVAGSEAEEALSRVEKMMKKLSLEEREIFRLKFFEEVSDGDVMTILGVSEGTIGSKIYRVLKRAHFLLFGESDERQGVYFGELTGLLSRVRGLEKIIIPEAFKLSLRADLSARIDRREFAVEAEEVEGPKTPPVTIMSEESGEFKGSNDPAKIFVEAVKEMRDEEEAQRLRDQLKIEREEKVFDFVEKWKWLFAAIPAAIFVGIVGFFVFRVFFNGVIERGYPVACKTEVVFKGDFSDGEKRSVNKGVSDRICGKFEVKQLLITRLEDGKVKVNVDVSNWMLEYKFAKKVKKASPWRIKEYARTLSSNEKSGKIPRNKGGAG